MMIEITKENTIYIDKSKVYIIFFLNKEIQISERVVMNIEKRAELTVKGKISKIRRVILEYPIQYDDELIELYDGDKLISYLNTHYYNDVQYKIKVINTSDEMKVYHTGKDRPIIMKVGKIASIIAPMVIEEGSQ